MSHNPPPDIDPSVLVGDGGRGYLKKQQRRDNERQRQYKDDYFSKDKNRMLTRQERARVQKSKSMMEDDNNNNNNNRNNNRNYDHDDMDDSNYGSETTKNNSSSSTTTTTTSNQINERSEFLYRRPRQPLSSSTTSNVKKKISKNNNISSDQMETLNTMDDTNTTTTTTVVKKPSPNVGMYVHASNQNELNELSAKILQAKLRGDVELVQQLQTQLDEMRKQAKMITQKPTATVDNNNEQSSNIKIKEKNKKEKEKEKEKSIEDRSDSNNSNKEKIKESNVSLITDVKLVKKLHNLPEMEGIQEKDDIMTLLKKEQNRDMYEYQQELLNTRTHRQALDARDTDQQFDDMNALQIYEEADNKKSRKRKLEVNSEEAEQARKRKRIFAMHNKEMEILQGCMFCLENDIAQQRIQHLVVAMGKYFYVCITPELSILHPYCCYIVPHEHIASMRSGLAEMSESYTRSQEEEWQLELFHIQNSLNIFYLKQFNCGTVFMETCKSLRKPQLRKKYHSHIEVIPVPHKNDLFSELPTYFANEIEASDMLWTSNPKLIRLNAGQTINQAIPAYMPYFHVQFGTNSGGYAHIIEDEYKFPLQFGQQIISGVLKLVLFKPHPESRPQQKERAEKFKKLYEPYQFEKLKQRMEDMEKKKKEMVFQQKRQDRDEEIPFSLDWMKAHNIMHESNPSNPSNPSNNQTIIPTEGSETKIESKSEIESKPETKVKIDNEVNPETNIQLETESKSEIEAKIV